jgi:hypothetical protein
VVRRCVGRQCRSHQCVGKAPARQTRTITAPAECISFSVVSPSPALTTVIQPLVALPLESLV